MNVPTTLPSPSSTGAPAPTTPGGVPGSGDEAPAGFTALLVDALAGQEIAPGSTDAEALTELAAAIEELAPAVLGDADGAEASAEDVATAEALAVALVAGAAPRPELAAALRAWQAGEPTADGASAGTGANAPTEPTSGATPTPSATEVAPASAGPSRGLDAAVQAATAGSAPTATIASVTAASTAATAAPDTRLPAAPEGPAPGATAAEAEAVPSPSPTATTGTTASSPAPTSAPAPAAPSPDMNGLHARLVARVIEAAEALEHAPPPRRMMVELPDGEGLRLQVALRGTEIHVQVQGAAGQGADLGAWGRELAAGLASRGLQLGGFETGTDGHAEQDRQPPAQDDASPAADRSGSARAGGPTDDDGALRL